MIFPLGSKLPEGAVPKLDWQPIAEVLKTKLPPRNFNFFGVKEKVTPKIIPSMTEHTATATIVSLAHLEAYLYDAPKTRLERIHWAILPQHRALLMGTPLLPLPGEALWQMGDSLMPCGFELEYPFLNGFIHRRYNPDGMEWLLWNAQGEYIQIAKTKLKPLGKSSFKLSKEYQLFD
jgi:hypothetical protein